MRGKNRSDDATILTVMREIAPDIEHAKSPKQVVMFLRERHDDDSTVLKLGSTRVRLALKRLKRKYLLRLQLHCGRYFVNAGAVKGTGTGKGPHHYWRLPRREHPFPVIFFPGYYFPPCPPRVRLPHNSIAANEMERRV